MPADPLPWFCAVVGGERCRKPPGGCRHLLQPTRRGPGLEGKWVLQPCRAHFTLGLVSAPQARRGCRPSPSWGSRSPSWAADPPPRRQIPPPGAADPPPGAADPPSWGSRYPSWEVDTPPGPQILLLDSSSATPFPSWPPVSCSPGDSPSLACLSAWFSLRRPFFLQGCHCSPAAGSAGLGPRPWPNLPVFAPPGAPTKF